ncbi:MAG: TolC family protein [Deltaproteobacteria bacterium]|nr:TolC family protein [Deltaproteobacteria bacterium]
MRIPWTTLLAGIGVLAGSTLSSPAAATQPLAIRDVLHRVDALDPQLRLKAAEQMQSEVALRRARWDRVRGAIGVQGGHAIGVSGLAPAGGESEAVRTADRFTGSAYADFRVPVFAGGAIAGAIDAAAARLEASRQDKELVRQELKRAALTAYAAVAAAQRQVEVARRGRDRAQALLELSTTRRDSGIGSPADVARSKLFLLRREEDLAARESDRDVAMAGLRASLLFPPGEAIEAIESLESVAHVRGQGPGNYPELRAMQAQAGAAKADVTVARAGYLPTVELFANGQYGNGWMGASPAGLGAVPMAYPGDPRIGTFQGAASTGVMLSWRAFDMYATRDRTEYAELAAEGARARLADAERNVRGARDQAAARESQAERRVRLLAGGEETAAEAVKLARIRYETGNTILTEVLDAEIEGIGIEGRKVQAALDLAIAHIDRLRAEGYGL